ncbi:hypothetical protein HK099_005782 [Clydaea vesicula]|uniref:GOLD domain-containing protein n=1 Tax=Clydaea vesicula TaxID=447962 RepID=A0AAD5XUQ5_9FUNG|nr:hypothetical protein HK099_005782 [Clydaea vesicula]
MDSSDSFGDYGESGNFDSSQDNSYHNDHHSHHGVLGFAGGLLAGGVLGSALSHKNSGNDHIYYQQPPTVVHHLHTNHSNCNSNSISPPELVTNDVFSPLLPSDSQSPLGYTYTRVNEEKNENKCINLLVSIFAMLLFGGLYYYWTNLPNDINRSTIYITGDRKLFESEIYYYDHLQFFGAPNILVSLFDRIPETTDIVEYPPKNLHVNIADGSYVYYRYDLQKGSTISLSWNFEIGIMSPNLMILSSKESFLNWKVKKRRPFFQDVIHEQQSFKGKFEFVTQHYGNYYIIFFPKSRRVKSRGEVGIKVVSKTYSLSEAYFQSYLGDKNSFDIRNGNINSKIYFVVSAPLPVENESGVDNYLVRLNAPVNKGQIMKITIGSLCCCFKKKKGYQSILNNSLNYGNSTYPGLSGNSGLSPQNQPGSVNPSSNQNYGAVNVDGQNVIAPPSYSVI